MIATREPGPILPPTGGRPAEPLPPDLRFNARADACAVTMTFNGTEYRAVLDLDGKGMCKPEEVAAMLVRLAHAIKQS